MSSFFSGNSVLLLCLLVTLVNLTTSLQSQLDKDSQRQQQILNELREMRERNGIVKLNSDNFNRYVNFDAKAYSIYVNIKLTGYKIPTPFLNMISNYRRIARSYVPTEDKNVFFAEIVSNELVSFYSNQLKVNFGPLIIYFPDSGLIEKTRHYDLRIDQSINSLILFVRSTCGEKITILYEFDYKTAFSVFFVTTLAVLFVYFCWEFLIQIFKNRIFLKAIISVFVILMMSGCMHNQIQSNPFIGNSGDKIIMIASGNRSQYVVETYIVSFLYAIIIGGFLMLNSNRDKVQTVNSIGKLASLVIIISGLYLLSKVLKLKIPYYPHM